MLRTFLMPLFVRRLLNFGRSLLLTGLGQRLPKLRASDSLGRCVFSRSRAERAARRGVIAHDIFLERIGVADISVDRLDHAPGRMMDAIAQRAARARNQQFHGWAEIKVEVAARNGREVIPTPVCGNRYHADIRLNIHAIERRDRQKAHAHELAANARWRGRPRIVDGTT